MVQKLLLVSALTVVGVFAAAANHMASQVSSVHVPDSPTLVQISKAFASLEENDTAGLQQLSYSYHSKEDPGFKSSQSLSKLLTDIAGGPSETYSPSIKPLASKDEAVGALERFFPSTFAAADLESFKSVTLNKGSNVSLFEAQVLDNGVPSSVLIAQDRSTNELLVMYSPSVN